MRKLECGARVAGSALKPQAPLVYQQIRGGREAVEVEHPTVEFGKSVRLGPTLQGCRLTAPATCGTRVWGRDPLQAEAQREGVGGAGF
jgi:hypothetical protein